MSNAVTIVRRIAALARMALPALLGLLAAVGLAPGPLRADLPPVTAPQAVPPRTPAITVPTGDDPAAANEDDDDNVNVNRNYRRGPARPDGDAYPEAEFEMLMKTVADRQLPFPADVPNQMNQMIQFTQLTAAQQNRAALELLVLLKDETPLGGATVDPAAGGAPNPAGGGLRVCDRANLALVQMAKLSFGTGPGTFCNYGERGVATAPIAAAELAEKWAAWWREARGLDMRGREALTKRLRRDLLMIGGEPSRANIQFAMQENDDEALGPLGEVIRRWKPRQAGQLGELLNYYCHLAMISMNRDNADARSPEIVKRRVEAATFLLDFARQRGQEDEVILSGAMWSVGSTLHRLLGGDTEYHEMVSRKIKQGDREISMQTAVIKKSSLADWQERLDGLAAGRDPTSKKPKADGPADDDEDEAGDAEPDAGHAAP